MTLYDLKRGSEITKIDLPLSVALGNFDGLHRGHGELIAEAKRSDNKSCVFTFSENPFGAQRIMTFERKLEVLGELGIDYVCAADFATVCHIGWQSFIDEVLIGRLNAVRCVCGFNFRFGKDAAGDARKLCEYMESKGRECCIISPYELGGEYVSSTRIRKCLAEGDVEQVKKLMGRPYSLEYQVIHGNGIGATLGFPTINKKYDPKDIKLPYGVYICRCMGYPAITNFGVRPTVTQDDRPFYETFILGFEGDLYGKNIKVDFYKMIRAERKFHSKEELCAQIARDTEAARDYKFE